MLTVLSGTTTMSMPVPMFLDWDNSILGRNAPGPQHGKNTAAEWLEVVGRNEYPSTMNDSEEMLKECHSPSQRPLNK